MEKIIEDIQTMSETELDDLEKKFDSVLNDERMRRSDLKKKEAGIAASNKVLDKYFVKFKKCIKDCNVDYFVFFIEDDLKESHKNTLIKKLNDQFPRKGKMFFNVVDASKNIVDLKIYYGPNDSFNELWLVNVVGDCEIQFKGENLYEICKDGESGFKFEDYFSGNHYKYLRETGANEDESEDDLGELYEANGIEW